MKGEAAFESFVPMHLQDVELAWTAKLAREIAETEFALGRLTGAFEALSAERQGEIVEAAIAEEAESSWKLAMGRDIGVAAALPFEIIVETEEGELLRADELNALDKLDSQEIEDLAAAMRYALDPLDDLPISRRLLENAHYLMTQSPRYAKRYPGEFRRSPNWIAGPGATLTTARFVPPVDEDMLEAFSRLEHFIHTPTDVPVLVRIALVHYQFEMIHPFIDGNGRIGRILTMLMLLEAGQIPAAILPLSDVLRERAAGYYASIERVEFEGDYEGRVHFFLMVIRVAAERATETCNE